MTRFTVKRRTLRMSDSKQDYLKFFAELAVEFDGRANRLEHRLLDGGTSNGSPDMNAESPQWEIDDVCCLTDATEVEVKDALVPLLDAYRRLARAQNAAQRATRVKRARRLEIAAQGLEPLLQAYSKSDDAEYVELKIDGWLEPMFGPCRWPEHNHSDVPCTKPVPWTKSDVGGGRSKAQKTTTEDKEQ